MPVCKNIQSNISEYWKSVAISKDKEASFCVYVATECIQVCIQWATVGLLEELLGEILSRIWVKNLSWAEFTYS